MIYSHLNESIENGEERCMKLTFLLLVPALLSVNASYLEQTDWSGGPGVQGPAWEFFDTFLDCYNITWTTPDEITVGDFSRRTMHHADEFPACEDYFCSGILTSSLTWVPMGTDWNIVWGDLLWTCYKPDSTGIFFQLRTGNTPETMGSWSAPIYESGTYLGDLLPDDILIIQYRVILWTTCTSNEPILYDVIIEGWYPGGIPDCGTSSSQFERILLIPVNPVAGSPQLRVRMPVAGQVTLDMYDLSGRSIAEIFDGYMQTGEYTYILGELNPGTYLIRLAAPWVTEVEKLIVIR